MDAKRCQKMDAKSCKKMEAKRCQKMEAKSCNAMEAKRRMQRHESKVMQRHGCTRQREKESKRDGAGCMPHACTACSMHAPHAAVCIHAGTERRRDTNGEGGRREMGTWTWEGEGGRERSLKSSSKTFGGGLEVEKDGHDSIACGA